MTPTPFPEVLRAVRPEASTDRPVLPPPVLPPPALTADVLVVGGGLVGGSLACALAQHGISVVVLDRDSPEALLEKDYDGRSSAIAGACQRLLKTVGIWSHMDPDVQPILDIRVTDGDSPFHLHYDHKDVGEAMGWMAENRVIRRGILARLAELDRVKLLAPCRIASMTRGVDAVSAVLEDGRMVRASLIVAADGRRSWVRAQAGIAVSTLSYGQSGIVLTIHHEKNHQGIAHERFLPAGPFAILPLAGGHHSSLVWSEKDSLVAPILALPPERFHDELMHRVGPFLGKVTVASAVFSYPLMLQSAKSYIDRRLVLVGDAAHGMHPVAGQGMNFGLRDGAALVEVLVNAKRLGLDLGDRHTLETYQCWRRPDNLLMLGLTDGVVRLFSNDNHPLRLARSLGLAAVNRLGSLKVFFMRHAMGDVGRVPRLMKGETC